MSEALQYLIVGLLLVASLAFVARNFLVKKKSKTCGSGACDGCG